MSEEITWDLEFDEQLTFGSRTEALMIMGLTSGTLLYEATYNYNLSRVGFFLVSEFVTGIGPVTIDRLPIYKGQNFLEVKPGIVEAYDLLFSPGFNPTSPLSIHLKIWSPSMPLSRSGGTVNVTPPTSNTSTPSTVTSATTSTTILAANANRKGASIWNASTATLYLDLDSGESATASTTDFTVALEADDYYELPYGYLGAVLGIWSDANGSALVREFT